jgi:hypothetical protein
MATYATTKIIKSVKPSMKLLLNVGLYRKRAIIISENIIHLILNVNGFPGKIPPAIYTKERKYFY